MATNELTDIQVALALLEKSTTDGAIAQTRMTSEITELVITMKETNVRHDIMLESSLKKADENEAKIKTHIEYAEPILRRTKRGQDNVDKMITGIFSKAGLVVFGFIIIAIGAFLGVDPSSIKIK
jgi:hypothetical protein